MDDVNFYYNSASKRRCIWINRGVSIANKNVSIIMTEIAGHECKVL